MTTKKDRRAKKHPNLELRGRRYYLRKQIGGKRYCRSTECWDLTAAERRADEMKVDLRDGKFGWKASLSPTFAEWVKTYQKTYSAKKRSADRDRQILAHALPVFGGRRLSDITKSDCVAYLNQRSATPDRRKRLPRQGTLSREQGLLAAVFNRAIEEGILTANPWKGISRPPWNARQRVLLEDEQARLVAVLNAEYQRFLVFALGTGMRKGELLGVCRKDVDLGGRLIHVRGDLAKSGKARTIPIREEVASVISAQWDALPRSSDEPLWKKDPSGVRAVLKRASKRAGIADVTVHDLRRTFGTRCAVAGMPLPSLQKIMGHASPEVTMKYYIHLAQRDLVEALEKVNLGLKPRVAAEVVSLEEYRQQALAGQ
jgi:integrase